jgi:predicted ATPase/DNA-binding SARP family transcriptional activator
VRIGILGPLEVRAEMARPIEVSGQRLRALLIRLAIDPGQVVSSDQLVSDLWAGAPPAAPGKALHALVFRLRAAAGRDLVAAAPGGYRLALDPGEVDAVEFERLVAAGQAATRPADRARALQQALRLWRGMPLADVAGAEFAAGTIMRLEELRLSATEDRIDADLALGESAHLVPELQALAAAHPRRERLRGQLMRALYAAGRQAAALEVYEQTRRELADQLGIDPSAELAAVHLAILRHDPGIDAAGAAARPDVVPGRGGAPGPGDGTGSRPDRGPSRAARRTNLPAALTSFVGREEECGRVRRLLDAARLVTLTGPGGAGKTRLACEVTAALVDGYADGVWLVPLAQVSKPVDVPQAVLDALEAADQEPPDDARVTVRPIELLIDRLADRQLILVVDNCEHVLDAVAQLADRVLREAAGVRILATSREPLGITGETLCPVPPLPLPPPGATAAEAAAYASVRLFADRATAVRPGFAIDARTAPLVVQICRELDGIPLAIELAAARARSLTLSQITDRLGDRFRLLTEGSRAALPRHQTLRAVVDWSWALLDESERTVLRRLSVFRGGATPDGAERVCWPDGRGDVVDVIAALIDKSLVTATAGDEVRYRLPETVRAYAGERLAEAGERDRIRSAHAAYFLDLAERAEPELRGHDQLRWAGLLTADRDNFAVALQHAIDTRDVGTALRLVGALAWFWLMHGSVPEAGRWAIAVREIAGDTAPPGLGDARAICAFTAAVATEMTGDPAPTPESISRALEQALPLVPAKPRHPALFLARPVAALFAGDRALARAELRTLVPHADPWVRAIVHVCLGYLALTEGQLAESSAELADGYARFQKIGERWGIVVALGCLAELALIRNDTAEAVRLGEEAYRYANEGVGQARGALLIHLGRAHAQAGDLDRARGELERGARTAERLGEYADAVNGHLALSELARRDADLAAARPPLERALALVEPRAVRDDFAQLAAVVFSRLGCLAEQEDNLRSAAEWHARAVRLLQAREPAHGQTLATVIAGLAALAAARSEPDWAARLLGIACTVRGHGDEQSLDVRRATAAASHALGRRAFEAAYAQGRRVDPEQALATAARCTALLSSAH